jgi:hypothetical protein
MEVVSMTPSIRPAGACIRISARCWIDRNLFDHHPRRRYYNGPANHHRLPDYWDRLLDDDSGLASVLVRVGMPLVAGHVGVRSHGQIGCDSR